MYIYIYTYIYIYIYICTNIYIYIYIYIFIYIHIIQKFLIIRRLLYAKTAKAKQKPSHKNSGRSMLNQLKCCLVLFYFRNPETQ